MKARDKTKEQLSQELKDLRRKLAELESSDKGNGGESDSRRRLKRRRSDLIDLVPEMVFETDTEGKLTFANDTALNALGYTQEDIERGLNVLQVAIPEDRHRAADYMQRLASGCESELHEYTVKRKDGSTLPVIVHSMAVFNEQAEHTGFRGVALDVSESKRAEEALRDSEQRYKFLFDNSIDGVVVIDAGTMRVVLANKTAVEMYGFNTKDKLDEIDLMDHIHPDDRERALKVLKEGLFGKNVQQVNEFRTITRNGKEKWISGLGTVIQYQGKKAGLVSFRDITEQKRIDTLLRESEEKLRVIFESVAAGITITQLDGNIIEVNGAAVQLHGFNNREEMIGRNAFELIAKKERARAIENGKKILSGELVRDISEHYTLLRADGSQFEAAVSEALLRDTDGTPEGFVSIARDITGRKRAEEELRKSEEKYRDLVEMERDLIFSVDAIGNITAINSATRAWGYEPKELLGRNFLELIPEEWQEKTAVELQNRLLQAGEITAETVVVDKQGEHRPIEYSAIVKRENGDYAGAQGICRDITERKRLEEALRRNADELQTILDSVPAYIFYKDPEGRMMRGNITAVTGLPEEKWRGKTVFELLPNLADSYHADDMEVVSTGEPKKRIIEPFETPKGMRWLQSDKLPVKDEQGNITGLLGFSVDITERVEAEEALKQSEEKLRFMFNSIADGVIVTDLEGRVEDVNEAALRIAGYSDKEEVIGKDGTEFIAEEDRDRVAQDMAEAVIEGHTKVVEYKMLTKDGREYYGEISAAMLRDTVGNPTGFIAALRDVTERKLLEEAELWESEEKRRVVFESIADGIVVMDLKGTIIDTNEAAFRMGGWSRKGDILGKNGFSFIAERDRDKFVDDLAKILQEKRSITVQYAVKDKDGSEYDSETVATLLRDSFGKPAGFVTVVRDISERKQTEEKLRDSEEKLRFMFESIADSIIVTNLEGKIIEANEAAVRMASCNSKEDLIGQNGFEWLVQEHREVAIEDMIKAVDQGLNLRLEFRAQNKDGIVLDVEANSTPLWDSSGNATGMITAARDISERKKMDAKLRQSEEMSRGMLESAATGIYVVQKGKFQYVSPLFEEITGYSSKELIGTRSLNYIHPDDKEMVRMAAVESLKGRIKLPHEFRFVRKDGSIVWILEKVASIQYKGRKATIASFMDITELKRAEEELERAYQELKAAQDYMIQSERLRALGEMAGGVAHDFNNILAVVLGRAQLALEDVQDDKLKKDLHIIEQTAIDAASTVRRLQDFARVRVDRTFEVVGLNEVVEGALHMVESRRVELKETKNIYVEINTELSKVPPVLGDVAELREALLNIVFNAMDAMPNGGKITVRSAKEKDAVVLSVSDTGVGMPKEVKGKVFEPFFTTKGRAGSGLGLSVAYGIVKRHSGTIAVESVSGEGTTVTIRLPMAKEVEVAARPEHKPSAVKTAKILLADDDPEVKEVLRLTLKHLGHTVTAADSGEAAIDAFELGEYDMVITDLGMPDLSGREVAKIVKEIKPGTPVVLITGWGMQLDKEQMAEIDGVITKPFSKDALSSQIADLLSANSPKRGSKRRAGKRRAIPRKN